MSRGVAQAAADYRQRGWPVIPCGGEDGKRPLVKWQGLTAEQVLAERYSWTGRNIGVLTGSRSGLLVLDVDSHKSEGAASLRHIEAEHGTDWQQTLSARTGSGGCHYFYQYDQQRPLSNRAGILPGVDIRADGGFLVLPPSANPQTGGRYIWQNEQPVRPAPRWLLEMAGALEKTRSQDSAQAPKIEQAGQSVDQYAQRALQAAVATVAGAPDGARNEALNREAFGVFRLAKAGRIDQSAARHMLESAARGAGLEPAEIAATLNSAWQQAQPSYEGLPGMVASPQALAPASSKMPAPLARRLRPPRFPVEALPPLLGDAVRAISENVQLPPGIAAQSVLAVASFAAARMYRLEHPILGGSRPLSLYFLSIAKSGDRKSTADKLAARPLQRYERELRQQYERELPEWRAAHAAWKERVDALKRHARRNKGPMSADEQQRLQQQLFQLECDEPRPPRGPGVVVTEPNAEGLYRSLRDEQPIAALMNDDAVDFLHGHGMQADNRGRMLGALVKLWDGATLTRTRGAAGESGAIEGRRLVTHLMIQPVVAAELFGDEILANQGTLARFLVAAEPSMAGTRFIESPENAARRGEDKRLHHYWARITDLLQAHAPIDPATGGLAPRPLPMSSEALAAWVALYNGVESELGPEGQYAAIQAPASRMPEQAARLAGVLAAVEGEHEVRAEQIERAAQLVEYYGDSMGQRAADAAEDQQELQAAELLEWIRERGGSLDVAGFKKLPAWARSARKARDLLALLVELGHLRVSQNGRGDRPAEWQVVAWD